MTGTRISGTSRTLQVANDPKLTVERFRMYPRFLYILGMLCRYGADVLDEPAEVCAWGRAGG